MYLFYNIKQNKINNKHSHLQQKDFTVRSMQFFSFHHGLIISALKFGRLGSKLIEMRLRIHFSPVSISVRSFLGFLWNLCNCSLVSLRKPHNFTLSIHPSRRSWSLRNTELNVFFFSEFISFDKSFKKKFYNFFFIVLYLFNIFFFFSLFFITFFSITLSSFLLQYLNFRILFRLSVKVKLF